MSNQAETCTVPASHLIEPLGADKFATMTKSEAIQYCYNHEDDFLRDYSKGGQRAFGCLISILENNTISPKELPDYGMDY